MLLSFSEPAMLPMVINGLIAAKVDLLPGVNDWAREQFASEFEAAAGRLKTQTVRDNTSGHWNKARRGTKLDMWWLSPRTKFKNPGPRTTPRKLAEVPVSFTMETRIKSDGTILLNNTALYGGGRNYFAFVDGFANAADMVSWFEKRHGLPFDGKRIVWHL